MKRVMIALAVLMCWPATANAVTERTVILEAAGGYEPTVSIPSAKGPCDGLIDYHICWMERPEWNLTVTRVRMYMRATQPDGVGRLNLMLGANGLWALPISRSFWEAYGTGAEDCTGELALYDEWENLPQGYPNPNSEIGSVGPAFKVQAYKTELVNFTSVPIDNVKCIRYEITYLEPDPLRWGDNWEQPAYLGGKQRPATYSKVRYLRWDGTWGRPEATGTGRYNGARRKVKAWRVRKCEGKRIYTRLTVGGRIFYARCNAGS